MENKNSRLSGFYKKTVVERQQLIADWAEFSPQELETLGNAAALTLSQANNMIENVVGVYGLPLGIATNFRINQRDYLIPVVIEEPSVAAALSNSAKQFREGGGFLAHSDEPIMIGQLQLLDIDDLQATESILLAHRNTIISKANETAGSILKRGGGVCDIDVRLFPQTAIGNMIVLHLFYDTRDAMGANAINTAVEHIAPYIEEITSARVNLRILSNLTDRRKAYASGKVLAKELSMNGDDGTAAVRRIVEAGVFAEVDPYRAATHNKGIMNGVDALILATGNDWRAIEAGAHAYAARDGQYRSLSRWWQDDQGDLCGSLEIPMAVGVVGGATKVHPMAQVALKILGQPDARTLAEIVACVGLAQNFAALRALANEGIQDGHMRMHAKQLVVAAGASPEIVAQITAQLIASGTIRLEKARELVEAFNTKELS